MPRPPRQLAKLVAAPLLDRVAARLSASSRQDADALREEVAGLRDQVARLESDMEGELALLHAELAAGRPTGWVSQHPTDSSGTGEI